MSAPPRLGVMYTREVVLQQMGFDPIADGKKALQANRDALSATNYEGGADHGIRLKAAKQIFVLAGVEQPAESPPDPSKPVSVTIVLAQPVNGHAGAALQTNGVRLHLGLGESGREG